MALRLRSNRSKSESNILDEMINDVGELQENSVLSENRYRTYTSEDFKGKERYFSRDRTRRGEEKKGSRSFVKRIIASLERRNESCKANDEFFAQYYKRNDCSNPNANYSFDENVCTTSESKIIGTGAENSYVPPSGSFVKNKSKQVHEAKSKVLVGKVPMPPNVERSEKTPLENFDKSGETKRSMFGSLKNKEENGFEVDAERSSTCRRESYIKFDPEKYFDMVNGEDKERKRSDDTSSPSSFNPGRSRAELPNRRDSANFYFLQRGNDDHKRNTVERLFRNSKEDKCSEKKTCNGICKKRLNRNKSFKDFFGSMIKWRKSDQGEKGPQRFVSCDHLVGESKSFDFKHFTKLPRVSSIQTIAFQDYEGDSFGQARVRNATIRPIYGGKRNEHLMDRFEGKMKAGRKSFTIAESMEDLVKPSAIRDIAKRLSQLRQESQVNGCIDQKRILVDDTKF